MSTNRFTPLLFMFLLFATIAQATSFTQNVTGYWTDPSGAGMTFYGTVNGVGFCSTPTPLYRIARTAAGYQDVVNTLMIAIIKGYTVVLEINGCYEGNKNVISQVKLCGPATPGGGC